MSLLSGGQAPMTDEAGGGTGDVETEKNSKDSGPLAAGRRHQEGCLCRKGDQSGGQSEVWPWRWVQSAAQSDKEHPYGESARRVELSACLAAWCTPGTGNIRAAAGWPALLEPVGKVAAWWEVVCFLPDLRSHAFCMRGSTSMCLYLLAWKNRS